MNNWDIVGAIGQDATVRQAGQSTVCNFSIAVKSGYGDREQILWPRISLWGKKASGRFPEFLVKGQIVSVSGELSIEEYNGKTQLNVRASEVNLEGSRPQGERSGEQGHGRYEPPSPGGSTGQDIPF